MTKSPISKPPSGLGAAGKKLWKAVHGDLPRGWAFEERERAILSMACHQADDLARLERAVRRDGTMTQGSQGQPVIHPAIPEARAARTAIERLLRQLQLPGDAIPTDNRSTERKAA